MNKKGLTPRNWIVLVVIIGMLLAASSYWINAWQDKYTPIESANLSSSYNKIDEMTNTANEMQNKLKSDTQPQTIGWLDFIVNGGYQALVSVLSVPLILVGFLNDVGATFGIPSVFINGLIVLITVAAVFGILSAIFRRKI